MLAVPTVTIIDDDDSVRRALTRLLNASGYGVRSYGSATEFLDDADSVVPGPGCLLLDVRLPGLGGLELLTALKKSGTERAVVFMTGHGDVLTGVKAMKNGAVDFLLKPFSDEELLDAVGRAVIRDGNLRATHSGLVNHGAPAAPVAASMMIRLETTRRQRRRTRSRDASQLAVRPHSGHVRLGTPCMWYQQRGQRRARP